MSPSLLFSNSLVSRDYPPVHPAGGEPGGATTKLTDPLFCGTGFGFMVVEVTVALSLFTEPGGVGRVAFTVSVNCAVAPFANATAVQLTWPVPWKMGT